MRLLLIILITIISCKLHAQEQKMKTIYGHVNDKYTFEGLDDVKVFTQDSLLMTVTGNAGLYSLEMSRKTRRIYFHLAYYESLDIKLAHHTRRLDVRMRPIAVEKEKYGEMSGKNALAWLPIKHLLGALGLRYEHFFKYRYSIGLYFDWYYQGREAFGSEEYTGFKATPTFRYFFMHHQAMGFYAQASAILGYFDFAKLNYEYTMRSGDEISVTYIFWTGGAGGAIGAYFALGKTRHFFIDINAGLQFMPATYPAEVETNYTTYTHNKGWWYIGGPGTLIELKIALGGIF